MKLANFSKSIIVSSFALIVFFGAFLVATAQEETVETTETSTVENGTNDDSTAADADTGTRTRPTLEEAQQNRIERVEERQENRLENIENRQEVRADRAAALTEARQNRILNLSANISNRMEAAIGRLFTISERFSSRIEKLNTLGVDTSAASAKLDEAVNFLNQARASLANIDAAAYGATTATEPRTAWQNVKAIYAETARLIRAAQGALRETLNLLKTAIAERETRPETTPETQGAVE